MGLLGFFPSLELRGVGGDRRGCLGMSRDGLDGSGDGMWCDVSCGIDLLPAHPRLSCSRTVYYINRLVL